MLDKFGGKSSAVVLLFQAYLQFRSDVLLVPRGSGFLQPGELCVGCNPREHAGVTVKTARSSALTGMN